MQREEFKRLGVVGDWDNPYTTMSYAAEATIAAELMKFAMNGQLYRGSKPVMWSVVEKTALAEAEVEYQEITSHTIWVKFPVSAGQQSIPDGRDQGSTPSSRALRSSALDRDLDDDALDHPRQPRDRFSPKIAYGALRGHRRAGGQLGEGRRQASCSPTRSPRT